MKYTTALLLAAGSVKADFDHEIKIGMEHFL
jgi:hypothetical protein